jgi:hypothetical protein
MRTPVLALCACLLTFGVRPASLGAQLDCEACHGELELLRQHVPTLEEARSLVVSTADIESSAHEGTACVDCHTGYARFPHVGDGYTETCASCHAEAQAVWAEGIHGEDVNADCASCHGVHDALSVHDLEDRAGARQMRRACAECHFEPRIPEADPHADSVSCSGCHEPHRTLPASDIDASVHATNQVETCGACHEEARETAQEDAHALAIPNLVNGAAPDDQAEGSSPPSCSACHGAHGMAPTAEREAAQEISERCAECHEPYAESFADSYHGQATELGSTAAATCDDCHAPHAVYAATDPRSSVSPDNILETCQQCHAEATESFARFQPHADHKDRDKYPYVYWSYRLMTGLLVGVFSFFGVHSALWLGRSTLDQLRPSSEREVTHDA